MTRATEIVERIKQLITTSRLRPGGCLPNEFDLCDNLGVSRSSLRETVRTLSILEIVEVQHSRGTFIGNVTLRPLVETLTFRMNILPGKRQHTLLEVVEVRWGIDLNEAEQVCSTFRGTGGEELHWLVDRITEVTGEGRPFAEPDRGPHVILTNRAGGGIIANLVVACQDVQIMILTKLPSSTMTDPSGAHTEILGAAEAGDVGGHR